MPERERRTERLRVGAPLTAGSVTLVVVERVVVHTVRGGAHALLGGSREPYAVVVRDAGGTRVLAVGAAPASLEALREAVPGLEAALRRA